MKKTLWSLAAAVVLLAALLIVRQLGVASSAKARYVFDTAQEAGVTTLKVTLGGDEVTLVHAGSAKNDAGGEGRWRVLPDSFPADPVRMKLVMARLHRLEDKEIVSKSADAGRLAEFGLSAEEAKRVEWRDASGETHVILLGHTSSVDFNSTYWKHPDAPEVYRTPGNFTHEIGVHPRDWKDKELFPGFEPEEVTSVRVRWDDSLGRTIRYTVSRGADSSYRLTTPGRADSAVMFPASGAHVFSSASRLIIDDAADHDDPNRGLARIDSPSVHIAVTLKNGTTHAFATGGEADQHYYFRHPVHGGVVKMLKARLRDFRKTPEQLLQASPGSAVDVPGWETVREPGAR